jgi:hypothetical protein
MINTIWGIASTLKRFRRPVKDRSYESFIRRFPCVACGSARRIEAAHIGPRGLSQKASSFTVLPLCAACHQEGNGALHKLGTERFQIERGIDFAALQAMFNHFYFQRTGAYAEGWQNELEARKAA